MNAANPLRLLWLRNIEKSAGPRSMTTEGFFSRRNATISTPVKDGAFSVSLLNAKKTVDYFSHEADRFASAAFESLLMEAPRAGHFRSTGWPLIRGYYAAFFALHALLRIHGWACTRITATSVTAINKDIDALYPGTEKISGGLYFFKVVNGGSEVLLQKMDTSGGGGSHEMLWSLLKRYCTAITDEILIDKTDPEANADLALAIGSFVEFVDKKNGPVWFTQVRNRVNYSHGYGAWYPYIKSTCDVPRVYAGLGGWLLPPSKALAKSSGDELVQFAEACSFILSLCRTTIEDLSFRSIKASPFRSSERLLALAKQSSAFI